MRPAPFTYAAPATLDEALALLGSEGTKVLAGGQSLMPLLNLRLARPDLLVDINRVPGLDVIEVGSDGWLRIGSLVRHSRLLSSLAGRQWPLWSAAVAHVGHAAIRERGTIGGSIAHADPTAELCLAAVTLDADIVVRSSKARRVVRAEDFFVDAYTTSLAVDELVVEVRTAPRPDGEGSAFLEVAVREGDFAIASVAALAQGDAGYLTGVHVGWTGAEGRALLARELGAQLEGVAVGSERVERLCRAATQDLQVSSDVRAPADYRRAMLGVLAARAVRTAYSAATSGRE